MAKKKAKKVAKKTAKSNKPTVAQRIAKMKKELEASRNKALRQGRTLFKDATREIFKKFKDLRRFSWNQYTPSWNDGDECVFSVYVDSLAINDEVGGESECVYTLEHMHSLLSNREKEEARIIMELATKKEEWEANNLKGDLETIRTRDPKEVEEKYKTKKAIIELLEGIDESIYREMFDEGTVIVDRTGVTVEECQHD